MAYSKTAISKRLSLNLIGVPEGQRDRVKREVGDFVVDEILLHVGEGRSPVEGEGRFKSLNREYASELKSGDRNPNLDLEGDMLDSLQARVTGDGIEVGIFNADQAIKAFGHNTGFEGHPFLDSPDLRRAFIPRENENFNRAIMSGVRSIIQRNVVNIVREPSARQRETDILTVSALFGDDLITRLLNGG